MSHVLTTNSEEWVAVQIPTWSMSNSYSYQALLINKNQGPGILERVSSWFAGMTMISIFSFMQVRKDFVSC